MKTKQPLTALLLSDGRPGHYHLAEGVLAAIARRRPVAIRRVDIRRRRAVPSRVVAALLRARVSPGLLLRLGYGVAPLAIPDADLVVSAGGETICANVAAARLRGGANIYCGTLKHVPPGDMSLVVSSYASHAALPNHIVTLKPNGMDPDELDEAAMSSPATRSPAKMGTPAAMGMPAGAEDKNAPGGQGNPGTAFGPQNPPRRGGLLIGGNSGLFSYSDREWTSLLDFITESHRAFGIRWIVSTSRRTDHALADRIAALSEAHPEAVEQFIDFRTVGPGTLPGLFARAEVVLCSEDSSTMISEAICARRPVVGFAPLSHSFKRDEAEYRQFMLTNRWCRFLPLADLTPDSFLAGLAEIAPLQDNHLDKLADQLQDRLPFLLE